MASAFRHAQQCSISIARHAITYGKAEPVMLAFQIPKTLPYSRLVWKLTVPRCCPLPVQLLPSLSRERSCCSAQIKHTHLMVVYM